jgi:hypothetical protein
MRGVSLGGAGRLSIERASGGRISLLPVRYNGTKFNI